MTLTALNNTCVGSHLSQPETLHSLAAAKNVCCFQELIVTLPKGSPQWAAALQPDAAGYTICHRAAEIGHAALVNMAQTYTINKATESHKVAQLESVRILNIFRENLSQEEFLEQLQPAQKGDTSIHVAVTANNQRALFWLLRNIPSSSGQARYLLLAADKKGNTPLHLAVIHSSSVEVNMLLINTLLDEKPFLFAPNVEGQTPLHLLFLHRQLRKHESDLKIFRILLSYTKISDWIKQDGRGKTFFNYLFENIDKGQIDKGQVDSFLECLPSSDACTVAISDAYARLGQTEQALQMLAPLEGRNLVDLVQHASSYPHLLRLLYLKSGQKMPMLLEAAHTNQLALEATLQLLPLLHPSRIAETIKMLHQPNNLFTKDIYWNPKLVELIKLTLEVEIKSMIEMKKKGLEDRFKVHFWRSRNFLHPLSLVTLAIAAYQDPNKMVEFLVLCTRVQCVVLVPQLPPHILFYGLLKVENPSLRERCLKYATVKQKQLLVDLLSLPDLIALWKEWYAVQQCSAVALNGRQSQFAGTTHAWLVQKYTGFDSELKFFLQGESSRELQRAVQDKRKALYQVYVRACEEICQWMSTSMHMDDYGSVQSDLALVADLVGCEDIIIEEEGQVE